MFSSKFKNFIKDTLYESSEEEVSKYIEHNKQVKLEIKERLLDNENCSFWVTNPESLVTDFYVINNDYLTEKPKQLTFDFVELIVSYNKTTIDINDKETKQLTLDGKTPVVDQVSKQLGTKPITLETVSELIRGILSNVKTDKRGIKKYANKKFLTDMDDSEEEIENIIKAKDKFIKVYDSTEFNIDKTSSSKITGSGSDMMTENGKSYAFDPSHLIGDESYRSIKNTQMRAEKSILDFEKSVSKNSTSEQLLPEELAANIIYKSLENVLDNPCNQFNISKDELLSKKEIPGFNTISEGAFNSFDKGTFGRAVMDMISTNPVEVLSPLAFLSMNIPESNWSVDNNGISSKKLVNHLFNQQNNLKKALISFPIERNRMLYDSIIIIPFGKQYKRINISSKAGLNGEGAAASISGIVQYLFDEKYFTEDPHVIKSYGDLIYTEGLDRNQINSNLNNFIKSHCSKLLSLDNFISNYEKEIKLLLLFSTTAGKDHAKICETYYKTTLSSIIKKLNGNNKMSKCIIEILSKQKYDFAQVNAKPHLFGETFSYDYYVQYPAKFSGSIKISQTAGSGIKFHIVGG